MIRVVLVPDVLTSTLVIGGYGMESENDPKDKERDGEEKPATKSTPATEETLDKSEPRVADSSEKQTGGCLDF